MQPTLKIADARRAILPVPATPFVSRQPELRAIKDLLCRSDVQLLTLIGPGGAGKTRLSLQVAAELLPEFEDGVFFVDLVPITDPRLMLPTVADVLGLRQTGWQSLLDALAQYLSGRRLLLVLDNLECLLAEGEITKLPDILRAAPAVKVLVTSREVLNLQQEWLFPVTGLPYPDEETAEAEVAACGAVQLFVASAQRVRPDFRLADELTGVVRICRLVEGMPLAIELAASWTKMLDCAEIAVEIQQNIDFLATSLRDVPARHRSIQAVFDQTWQQLSESECATLKRLSVFRGGFGRQAAAQVVGASLDILLNLVDKSLLRPGTEGRYQIHELLRQYSEEQLNREELAHTQAAHSAYYVDFLDTRMPSMLGGRQLQATAEIASELENIWVAWQWAVAHKEAEALFRSAETLGVFLTYKSRYLESIDALEQAIASLSDVPPQKQADLARVRILHNLGWSYIRLGRLREAEERARQCLEIYRRLDIPPVPGQGSDPLLLLAILALIRGSYSEAARLGNEALQLSLSPRQIWNSELAYYLLTRAALGQGQYELAEQYAQQAYQAADEASDRWFMAYCLSELGNLAMIRQDYAVAKGHYQASYAIREAFADPEGMAVALNHLGEIFLQERAYEKAQALYERSAHIYRDINDAGGLATAQNGLGKTAVALGAYGPAQAHFSQALEMAATISYVPLILEVLIGVAELLLQTGQAERAVELLTLTARHPAGQQQTKARAQQALSHYQPMLAPERFAAAVGQGQDLELESTITVLRADLAGPVKATADRNRPLPAAAVLVDPLTARELEVLQLIAAGLTNRAIADQLIIAVGTVKSYTSQIYSKLQVTSRTQAVARARELGLLSF